MEKKKIYLIRHGETEWSLANKHTGLTDIGLTPHGIEQAEKLASILKNYTFTHVFSSPLKRAIDTCSYAGLTKQTEILEDLQEWNYGDYEGLTSEEIHKKDPSWYIFTKGAPGGESILDVKQRTARVLKKIENLDGDILLISHGHFLRALTTRYLALPISDGRLFYLAPATLSILGYEHEDRVILGWNNGS